jgi:hypothetical protein
MKGRTMTATFSTIYQIIVGLVLFLNSVNVASLPTKWQGLFSAVLTLAMGVQGVLAHFYTPTGVKITPGTTVTTPEVVGPQVAAPSKAA